MKQKLKMNQPCNHLYLIIEIISKLERARNYFFEIQNPSYNSFYTRLTRKLAHNMKKMEQSTKYCILQI